MLVYIAAIVAFTLGLMIGIWLTASLVVYAGSRGRLTGILRKHGLT